MHIRPYELADIAIEALPVAVVVVDRAGRVARRNAAASALLPAGATLADILPCRTEDDCTVDWSADLAGLAGAGGRISYQSLRLAGDSPGARLVDVHLAAVEHVAAAAVVTVEDVTDRQSLHRRLAASERMAAVGNLAAKVAHELNNPLDGILRYVGLAERTLTDGDVAKTRTFLERVRTGVGRMTGIIADLLNYSRVSGRPTEMTPIRSLIEQSLDVMAPHLEASGVTVVCDLDDGDSRQAPGDLFQVMCNLVKNAADAMASGGRLTVVLRAGESIVVTFADTGDGIDPERMDDIFRPFFTTKAAGKGTGLGLSICREIAQRAGGDVTASNRRQGGAIFTLTVPRHRCVSRSTR